MNIAEHIAYLIGDFKRVVIPIYSAPQPPLPPPPIPDGETNGGGGNGTEDSYSIPKTDPVLDNVITDTTDDIGIIIDDPMRPDLKINQDDIPVSTSPSQQIVNYIKKDVLERWIKDIIAKTSKLLPNNLKLHLTKTRVFTAGEWDSNVGNGIGYNLNMLDSSDIISVSRYDGEIAYDCRQIPFHLRSKSRFGSGFLEECSETDPVYYVKDMMLMVEPKPEDTHLDALDGFCTIDYTCYPDINVNWDNMYGVPFDMQQVILVGTASRCKKFQLDSLEAPELPQLNPDFKVPQLDNPDIIDAIDIAKNLIDNYGGNSFKDFMLNEDIDMATMALAGSTKSLEIAATELSEQDKISAIYLSEYSQNISKFSQDISKYASIYKKLANDYDVLQKEYQELLYSFRGELPDKKQLGASDKKLAQIKQVVQN